MLASGITLGLAALTRFVAVVTLPFMALYGLSQPESWTRKIRLGLLCAAAIVITFSPWPIRNALLFHAFFPSESGGTRQMWTAANPAFSGLHYTRNARRLILWADPEASEIERNQRLQQETRAFIRANPAWYLDRMLWRASHYLTLTRWQDAIQQEDWRQRWHHVITWIAALFGTLGCVLACFKRPRSGLLISSIFLILVGLHSLAGELIRYRLTSEWIWGLGLAYLLAWFSQAARHSMFAMDNTSERPLHASIYDFRWARWGIPVLLLVPFLVLAVRIPIHQARLRHETLPELPKPAAELIAEAGLTEPFVQQDTQLYDVAYYIHHAKQQTAPDITYPRHVIVFRGEMSHFIFRPDGRVRSFSFKVNKAGLHIGDLVTLCRVDEAFHLFLPVPLQRTPGLIVGMISGTGGGAGEPRFAVMDMYVYQDDRWIPCQTPDQAEP